MKKVLALVLALVMMVSLVACGSKDTATTDAGNSGSTSSSPAGNKVEVAESSTAEVITEVEEGKQIKDEFVWLVSTAAPFINVFQAGADASQGAMNHLYGDTLITMTQDFQYKPCLAASWDVNEECTDFVFHLRDDVYFHNGEKMTADDFVYTATRGNENPGCHINSVSKKFASIEALDDTTLHITTTVSEYDYLDTFSAVNGFIAMNRKACEADPEKGQWIGTGPYMIESFEASNQTKFVKNEKYWDAENMGVSNKITMKYVGEETAQHIMLDNGECDFVQVRGVYITQYGSKPGYKTLSYTGNNCNYLSMNTIKPPLDDVNLRLAINYAIDIQEIIDIAFTGYATPVKNGALWGYHVPYRNESLQIRERNLELAKEYLAKSSYNGEELLLGAGMADNIAMATVMQAQLEQIGIKVKIHQTDFVSLLAMTGSGKTDLDMVCSVQVFSTLSPTGINNACYDNSWNTANWVDEEAKELAEKNPNLPYNEERIAMYQRIQEIIYEQVPYIPLLHYQMFYACPENVEGIRIYTNANHDVSQAFAYVD